MDGDGAQILNVEPLEDGDPFLFVPLLIGGEELGHDASLTGISYASAILLE